MINNDFFKRNAKVVARNLLGKILCRRIGKHILKGKIVETEAYFGLNDPGSHAFHGPTPRSKVFWKEPGTIYVYFTYGSYFMLNFICERFGKPGAVLIRALEPLDGIKIMRKNRGKDDLTTGPGKLTQAYNICKKMNGKLLGKELWIEDNKEKFKIVNTTRIGLSKGGDLKLRYYIKDNKFISRK